MGLDLKKFIDRFVEEAREQVGAIGRGLVAIEKNPKDVETLHAVFRCAHTIKGGARMLKLGAIADLAHGVEDVLGALREGRLAYTRELADVVLQGVDAIAAMVDATAAGRPIEGGCEPLRKRLAEAAAGHGISATAVAAPSAVAPAAAQAAAPATSAAPGSAGAAAPTAETVRVKAERLDELVRLMGEIVSAQNHSRQRAAELRELEGLARAHAEALSAAGADGHARRAQELFRTAQRLSAWLDDDSAAWGLVVGELQEKALALRMVPLSSVFDPLYRLARDLARSLGKDAELAVEGGDIEIDRKIAERLSDPLLHMVRNALDHGIEPPEARAKAGKPATGRVQILARYDSGSVRIDVVDDGGGIPVAKVRKTALEKGLADETALERLSEAELLDFIFQPGFSTRGFVTELSGRGVGMDVVKRNIVDELKGSIRVETREGSGTSFHLRLPLTLAIMRVLRFRASGRTFGCLSSYTREVVRCAAGDLVAVLGRPAVRLRDELVGVAEVHELLGLAGEPGGAGRDRLLLVMHNGAERLALAVDELLSEEDCVVKPLPKHLEGVALVSGVTLSGDNELLNVLHVPALLNAAKSRRGARRGAARERAQRRVLVVDDSMNTRDIEKSILEAQGYVVVAAGDGAEGLRLAQESAYDLVITDVEMPRMDGFTLTERLRALEAYRSTPVVIVTSLEKDSDKRRGMEAGASAYVLKGDFDQSCLLDTVRNLLG